MTEIYSLTSQARRITYSPFGMHAERAKQAKSPDTVTN